MKPYRSLPILECGEPLLPISADDFLLTDPPPYAVYGAQYLDSSPWMLRSGVLERLYDAQRILADRHPAWRIKLFDAYRPNTVQSFMVQHEFLLLSGGRSPDGVPEPERASLWERTYRIWAEPSDDPATPPPHSTGAALDLTLVDEQGREVSMGSPIDENSDRSNPDYFVERNPAVHANRELLREVMQAAGFRRHPFEWWHFSVGDQMWVWQIRQINPDSQAVACYGRADLLKS
jgi:D-alanyl-D-alanine dipeptidase